MDGLWVFEDDITSAIATIKIITSVTDGQENRLKEFGKQTIPGGHRRVILMEAVLPLE